MREILLILKARDGRKILGEMSFLNESGIAFG